MAKRQLKRTAHGIIPHAVVRHLGPATGRQTNIRPVQICQKRAVSARLPAKNVQQAGDGVFPRPIHLCAGTLSASQRAFSELAGDVSVQAAASPSSNRRTPRISGSILSLRKFGDCSGHCTLQACRADKIAFVNAIPCRGPDLDKQQPAKGRSQITGTDGRADCNS